MDEYQTTTTDTHTIVELPAAQPAPPRPIITVYAFRKRLTVPEKTAIYTAAESTAAVRVYLDDLAAASYVDLDDDDVLEGLQVLEAAGLLANGRPEAIVAAPVQDSERP